MVGWQGWHGLVSVGCSLVGWVCSPCCTIYLLHCRLGISLSICLSVCLLALACFPLLPLLKLGFLGCCDSHVILACCTRQGCVHLNLCTGRHKHRQECNSNQPAIHITIHKRVCERREAWCAKSSCWNKESSYWYWCSYWELLTIRVFTDHFWLLLYLKTSI